MNLSLSPKAAEQLSQELDGRILRVAFTTGCGGSGYRLSSADEPAEGDVIIEAGGVRVALDDMSASRLDGAIIEYDAETEGYRINHPDAVEAVWCG